MIVRPKALVDKLTYAGAVAVIELINTARQAQREHCPRVVALPRVLYEKLGEDGVAALVEFINESVRATEAGTE